MCSPVRVSLVVHGSAQRHQGWCPDCRISGHDEGPFVDLLEDRGTHHIGWPSSGDDLPSVKQDDVFGETGYKVELVTDGEDRPPASRKGGEELECAHLVADVEESRRLVEYHRPGILCDGARDPEALPLSTRQLVRAAIEEAGDSGQCRGVANRAFGERVRSPGAGMRGAPKSQVSARTHWKRGLLALYHDSYDDPEEARRLLDRIEEAFAKLAERSGRRVPPVITIAIEASRPPNEKLAESHPRPVASAP